MADLAIKVDNVNKEYKLYERHRDRLKEALRLSKKVNYRTHHALHNLSFVVRKGETVGIIGTNGAGKSTILKIITGVLNPTSGEVSIDGRISALLELGAGFNLEYTGIENIYLNGTMIGFSKEEIDQRMESILQFADIGEYAYQPIKTYSSGMFVRLAFAVAINIEPEILIVDEALSVGDVFFQAKCYRKFEEFKKEGKTILFVTHDLGSISKYCDRVVLLNKGKKISEGSPAEMVDLYKKVLVNQVDDEGNDTSTIAKVKGLQKDAERLWLSNESGQSWKSHFVLNPEVQEYGDKKAEIIDFGIMDEKCIFTNTIIKGQEFTCMVKIRGYEKIDFLISAFTITDRKGTDITGTNTMIENYSIVLNEDEEIVVRFKQKANLQGGEYLINYGCTGYQGDDFEVHHRIYGALALTIISDKNTVGYYDMNSEVSIDRIVEE